MSRGLTRAGWPRPRNPDGLPIPWISPPNDLSQKDGSRHRRVAGGWICQVCGLRLAPDRPAYCVVNIEGDEIAVAGPGDRLPPELGVHAMDNGLLHRPCLRLALAHCPELKRLRAAGQLVACEVPPGSIEAFGADVLIIEL